MPNFSAALITTILLTTSNLALACSIFPAEPADVFKSSDSVILARPLEISPKSDESERNNGDYSYEQTVTWQVISVWKGNFTKGDTFVTSWRISSIDPCSGWGVIREYQPKIFHAQRDSSLNLYLAIHVDSVVPQLNSLKEKAGISGK